MSWLDIIWWLFIAFLVVVLGDFIRLWILRVIWKRRHERMVEEIRQRSIIHGLDHK